MKLTEDLSKFNNINLTDEAVATELILYCENIQQNVGKFTTAQSGLENLLANSGTLSLRVF
jgi:hypothetical protein